MNEQTPIVPKHGRFKDLTGRVFGRLTVISFASRANKLTRWNVRCSCGNNRIVRVDSLVTGRTQSCGCLRHERLLASKITHGMTNTRTHTTWSLMLSRCSNPKDPSYRNYGGRGIGVCDSWLVFENFLADMGTAPDEASLDRINNDLGYSPDNCRWATRIEQANNKRTNHLLTYGGKTQSLAQWSREVGVRARNIMDRLGRGWLPEKALFHPVRKTGREK